MFQIWPHVKAANSHLSSVCEIGAIIGSLWRDMDPKEKQRYNDLFAKDKVELSFIVFLSTLIFTSSYNISSFTNDLPFFDENM